MITRNGILKTAVASAALAAIALAPSPARAAPGGGGGGSGTTRLTAVFASGANGLDPNDPAWALAPPLAANLRHLNYAETGMGSGTLYEKRLVHIKAMHNGVDIFFRLDWADATQDLVASDPNLFADGAGIQLPIAGAGGAGGQTNIMMGSQNNPVNIMMWRADWPRPQNIVAGGIGTIQKSPDAASQNIAHFQRWANGTWTVIVSRPMAAASVNQVAFVRGMNTSIAFMNVDGFDFERDGHKTVSDWNQFSVQ